MRNNFKFSHTDNIPSQRIIKDLGFVLFLFPENVSDAYIQNRTISNLTSKANAANAIINVVIKRYKTGTLLYGQSVIAE